MAEGKLLRAAAYSGASASSHDVSIDIAPDTANSGIAFWGRTGGTVTINSAVDNNGDAWTVEHVGTGSGRAFIIWHPNTAANKGTSTVLTIGLSGAAVLQAMPIELARISGKDVSGTNNSTSATTSFNAPSGALNSTFAQAIAVAALSSANGTSAGRAIGNGFTLTGGQHANAGGAYKSLSATGNQQAQWSWTNATPGAVSGIVVVFKKVVIVAGSQATVTMTAQAGALAVRKPGSQATETVTANAGTPRVVVAGSQATSTATANAGAPQVVSGYSAEVMADTPLAYYRLGEASGTTAEDSSGNNRDGTYEGSPQLGQAAVIHGDADTAFRTVTGHFGYFQSPWGAGHPLLVANIVHEFWVEDAVSNEGHIWGEGNEQWRLSFTTVGIDLKISNTTYAASLNVGQGQPWDGNRHHVVIKATATRVYLYYDGQKLLDAARVGTSAPASNSPWVLGTQPGTGAGRTGTFDEYAIYTDLSEARIVAHYQAGTPAATSVAGNQASETDTAQAGSPSVRPAGQQATEADTAQTGTARVTVAGGLATVTDTANPGTARVATAGALATETDSGQTGARLVRLTGGIAAETDTPHAGTPAVRVAGGLGSETDLAHPGAARVTSLGGLAAETDTAHGGVAAVAAAGQLASEAVTAGGGSARVTVAGQLAAETDTPASGAALVTTAGALAGEVDTAHTGTAAAAVQGALAGVTETALAGVPRVVLTGQQALEGDLALGGASQVRTGGGQQSETDNGLAGSARAAVAGGRADETDSCLPGAARVTAAGGLAVEADTALPGSSSTAAVGAGSLAAESDSALSGSAAVTATGGQAAEGDTPAPGAAAVTVSGQTGLEGDTAAAGAARVAVPGGSAVEVDVAFAGLVAATWPGGLGVETTVALPGSPLVLVEGEGDWALVPAGPRWATAESEDRWETAPGGAVWAAGGSGARWSGS